MYEDFHKKNLDFKCGYHTYRAMVKEMNISFAKLGQEECETCNMFQINKTSHEHEWQSDPDAEYDGCDLCKNQKQHISNAIKARTSYRVDSSTKWPDSTSVRSVDMQKVIMLPRLPGLKTACFTRRIIAFHETFAVVGTQGSKNISKASKDTQKKKHSIAFAANEHEDIENVQREMPMGNADNNKVEQERQVTSTDNEHRQSTILKEVNMNGHNHDNAANGATRQNAKKSHIAVIWHEGLTGRSCHDVTSAFCKAIKQERDIKEIIFWLDNCTGQNKNWCLFTAMITLVNSDVIAAENITFKYFQSGHTFMSADAVHAGVEREMAHQSGGNIYDFEDFASVISKSNGQQMITLCMESEDITEWKGAQSQAKLKNKNRPMVADIKVAQFSRGSRLLKYKTDHDSTEYEEFDFLQKKYKLEIPAAAPDIPRGIQSRKKQDIIQKLCPHMPQTRRNFWEDLRANDEANDLIDVL